MKGKSFPSFSSCSLETEKTLKYIHTHANSRRDWTVILTATIWQFNVSQSVNFLSMHWAVDHKYVLAWCGWVCLKRKLERDRVCASSFLQYRQWETRSSLSIKNQSQSNETEAERIEKFSSIQLILIQFESIIQNSFGLIIIHILS